MIANFNLGQLELVLENIDYSKMCYPHLFSLEYSKGKYLYVYYSLRAKSLLVHPL